MESYVFRLKICICQADADGISDYVALKEELIKCYNKNWNTKMFARNKEKTDMVTL